MDAARRTISTAAAKAADKLGDGAPLEKAAPALLTEKVLAARKTVITYRGPC